MNIQRNQFYNRYYSGRLNLEIVWLQIKMREVFDNCELVFEPEQNKECDTPCDQFNIHGKIDSENGCLWDRFDGLWFSLSSI